MEPPAPFRRSEFEAKAALARRELLKSLWVVLGVMVVGFPALFAIVWIVPTLPQVVFRNVVYALLAVAIGAMFLFAIRASRLMRRIGLVCPACKKELVGTGRRRGPDTAELVLRTGKCPGCGAQLLDPAEVRPGPDKLTRADHIQALSIIGLLTVGLVATFFFGNAMINATRARRCTARYATARDAADSAAVDARRLTRKGTLTCGDLRR